MGAIKQIVRQICCKTAVWFIHLSLCCYKGGHRHDEIWPWIFVHLWILDRMFSRVAHLRRNIFGSLLAKNLTNGKKVACWIDSFCICACAVCAALSIAAWMNFIFVSHTHKPNFVQQTRPTVYGHLKTAHHQHKTCCTWPLPNFRWLPKIVCKWFTKYTKGITYTLLNVWHEIKGSLICATNLQSTSEFKIPSVWCMLLN